MVIIIHQHHPLILLSIYLTIPLPIHIHNKPHNTQKSSITVKPAMLSIRLMSKIIIFFERSCRILLLLFSHFKDLIEIGIFNSFQIRGSSVNTYIISLSSRSSNNICCLLVISLIRQYSGGYTNNDMLLYSCRTL